MVSASSTARDPAWGKLARLAARLPRLLNEVRTRPSWVALFLFGRLLPARRAVSAWYGRRPAIPLGDWRHDPVAPSGPPPGEVVAALDRDGISPWLHLPPEIVAEIRAFAEGRPCHGGRNWDTGFSPDAQPEAERLHGESLIIGHYPDNDRLCPAIRRLVRSPWLRTVAAGYLRAPPVVLDVRLWWSFPSSAPTRASLSQAGQETFHFDLTDWKQLKFFFYLTDVDQAAGPHRFVRGSHAKRPLSHQLSLFVSKTDAEIASAYGPATMMTLTGPAGSGFAEDPFGFHTGSLVQQGRRLMLEVSFGVSGMMRRRDFEQP